MPTLNELLHAASRTFAIGIDRLPSPLREEVEIAYLLLRVSDYLEDNEVMEPERKAELLTVWAEVLEESRELDDLAAALQGVEEEDTPDALVARSLEQVYAGLLARDGEARAVVVRHVADSTRGMARWALRGPDIADEADLDDYMHEVAGRVGWLLTDLFSLHEPRVRRERAAMMELGREFGLALQTVNVIRGLHSDWERGWIFIPRSFVEGEVSTIRHLFQAEQPGPEALAILDRLVDKADRHLDAARRYIEGIPRSRTGIRLFCQLPFFFAVRTLAISRSNPLVFREETKIGRDAVRRIVRDTRLFGWSNRWVSWYGERLNRT